MAEGLQRKIEYSDLKFTSSFAREKILDFQTWEVPGEHARGNFRLLLSENETGINSMKDRKSTRLNSSHSGESRMPSSA